MGNLKLVADELARQPAVLKNFLGKKLSKAPPGSLFVGSGDSYAASICAFHLSSAEHVAIDPYSLLASTKIAEAKDVFFVSVSGRTTANVAAAKKLRGVVRRTTAVTANGKSPLARETDRTILLPYDYRPRVSGMLSFSLSLLAVLKLALGPFQCDFDSAFSAAMKDAQKVMFADGTNYFLGNGAGYGVSLYAAAKMYEVLGAKAHAELLEEFGHMELFSLRKDDAVNIFSFSDPRNVGQKLHKALAERRYKSTLIPSYGSTQVEDLFYAVFLAQMAMLGRAERLKLKRPSFVSSRDKLWVSDSLIY